MTLVLIIPYQVGAVADRQPVDQAPPQTTPVTVPRRDVYWLVFDRYGSDLAHELMNGTKNDLTPWLREKDFTVLDDSHANYVRTASSMATTLHMQHLDEMAGMPGPGSSDLGPIFERLQASPVVEQFKAMGYRYYHIGSWWDPTRVDRAADVNLHAGGSSDFVATLYDESALNPIARRLGLADAVGQRRWRHYVHNAYGLDALDDLAGEPGPKFVLGHVLLPHQPNVFDSDGSFMTADEQEGLSEAERYRRQLDYTNTRLRAFIERVQSLPEAERPIVILQADEGPETPDYHAKRSTFDWSTASDEDIETKYGILNAWYLPGGEDLDLYPEMTAINTFPVLFSRYFGLDYPLLADRVYLSKQYGLPYDLTDVTDRLPSLR
jgi:hypothetical protein